MVGKKIFIRNKKQYNIASAPISYVGKQKLGQIKIRRHLLYPNLFEQISDDTNPCLTCFLFFLATVLPSDHAL